MADYTQYLPKFTPPTSAPGSVVYPYPGSAKPKRGLVTSALSAGVDELQGLGGAALGTFGALIGNEGLERRGLNYSQANELEAAENGRPEYDIPPWREGGGGIRGTPGWLAYQSVKMAPLAAGLMGTAALGALAVPAAPVAASIGAGVTAGSVVGLGAMGQSAAAEDGDISFDEAKRAAMLAPVYGGAEYLLFGRLPGMAGFMKNAAAKAVTEGAKEGTEQAVKASYKGAIARGIAQGGATEAVTESFQTGLELSFRNDMTPAQKAQQIIDAALTGGAVGGVYGGAASGIGRFRQVTSGNATVEDMNNYLDEVLADAAPAPPEDTRSPAARALDEARQLSPEANSAAVLKGAQANLAEQAARVPPTPVVAEGETPPAAGANPPTSTTSEVGAIERVKQLVRNRRLQELAADPDRELAQFNRNQIDAQLAVVAKDIASGKNLAENTQIKNALVDELSIRDGLPDLDADRRGSEQRTSETVTPPTPPSGDESAATIKEFLERRGVAKSTSLYKNVEAQTQEELTLDVWSRIRQERDAGRTEPKYMTKLAQDLGILDEKGAPRKIQNDIMTARKEMQRLQTEIAGRPVADVVEQTQRMMDLSRNIDRMKNTKAVLQGAQSNLEPTTTKNEDGTYSVRMATGKQVNVVYDRTGDAGAGWYDVDNGTKIPLKPGQKGVTAVATAINREARVRQLPRRYYRNPGGLGEPGTANIEDTQAAVDNVVSRWDGVNATVVESPADLPPNLATRVAEDAAEDALGMIDDDGNVYVFNKNLPSPDMAPAVVFHEVLGHKALRQKFQTSLDKTLEQIYRSNPSIRKQADAYMSSNSELLGENRVAHATEEVLARMSEKGPIEAKLFDKLARLVREFARRMGLNLNISDREVQAILASAHSAIGKSTPATGGVRYMSAAAPATPLNAKTSAKHVGAIMNQAESVRAKAATWIGRTDISPRTRRVLMGWMSLGHLAEESSKFFKPLARSTKVDKVTAVDEYANAEQFRTSINNIWAQLGIKSQNKFENMMSSKDEGDQSAANSINTLMIASYDGVHPGKTWDDPVHDHLRNSPYKAENREKHRKYKSIYDALGSKNPAALAIYNDMVALNRANQLAMSTLLVYNTLAHNGKLPDARLETSPMYQFSSAAGKQLQSSANAEAYWRSEYNKVVALAKDVINTTDDDTSVISDVVAAQQASVNEETSLPYFHSGRFGDYSISFHIKGTTDADGVYRVDPDAIDAISKVLEDKAGITDIELKPGVGVQSYAFVRTDSESQMNAATAALRVMARHSTGYVIDEVPDPSTPMEARANLKQVKQHHRTSGNDEASVIGPMTEKWVQKLTRQLENSPYFSENPSDPTAVKEMKAEAKRAAIREVYDAHIDSLPSSSQARMQVRKKYVPGFSRNMMRSHAYRLQAAAHAMASLATEVFASKAMSKIGQDVTDAETSTSGKIGPMKDLMEELIIRRTHRPNTLMHDWTDVVRAWNHVYFLGLSPAYFLTNLTQVGVLLWPELAKRHGFRRSFEAIKNATPVAFSVVKAMIGQSIEVGKATGSSPAGLRQFADGVVDESILERAGIDKETAAFVMRMVRTGTIDIGSAARDQGRYSEGRSDSASETAVRVAGSFGLYSEIITRLTAALSARELALERKDQFKFSDQQELQERIDGYSKNVVTQSMFNYAQDFVGRQTTKQGFAGSLSRLSLAFLTYQFQLTEKLYREFYDSYKGDSPEVRSGARKFLLGHVAVVTALAGTMGLPLVSVVAGVADAIGGTFGDDEPEDILTSYRWFLSQTFGTDVGEVVARGLPRALNFDMSTRTGEQDIIPFSKLLTDKREWKEALGDSAVRGFGAPYAMLTNILSGGEKIMGGNLVGGLEEAMPVAAKSLFRAYELSDKGYVDKAGNQLPMSAGAYDVALKLLTGFNTGTKQEYGDANFASSQRTAQIAKRAQLLRAKFATNLEQGDMDSAREWLKKILAFDRANPGFAITPGLSEALMRRQRARADLEISPPGVSLRGKTPDLPGFELLGRNTFNY